MGEGVAADANGNAFITGYFRNAATFGSTNLTSQGGADVFIAKLSEEESVADLDCDGSLNWVNVKPGATVTGSFTVENIGEPESLLDWEINEVPEWGVWIFIPSNGDDLKPEDGPVIVGVTVTAPNEPNTEFSGEVKIVNKENISDVCTIQVSLATPLNVQISHPFLQKILNTFPNAFPILRHLLRH